MEYKLRAEVKNNSSVQLLLAVAVLCGVLALAFGHMSTAMGITSLKIAVLSVFFAGAVLFAFRLPKDVNYENNLKAVIAFFLFICFEVFAITGMQKKAFFITLCNLLALLVVALYLKKTKQLTHENMMLIIIFASFAIQLGYILETSVVDHVRQHDVGWFEENGIGHAGYIEYFLATLRLPSADVLIEKASGSGISQLYHPPLHHFLAALWMRAQMMVAIPFWNAVEGIQFLTMFYSTACVIVAKRILEEAGLEKQSLAFAVALVAFCPVFIIFSGSINNDVLSVLFTLSAMLATIKWMKSDKLVHLLQIALFIGLGMSTKASAGIIAVPVALVMLVKIIKTKEKIKMAGQYTLFGAVVFPLGLWWTVRNYMLLKAGPYIPRLSDTNSQYVGFRSLLERYTPFVGIGRTPYVRFGGEFEYNVWSGLFKSSAFGEFAMFVYSDWAAKFAGVLFATTVLICITAFFAMLYSCFFKKNFLKPEKAFMAATYIAVLASYLFFCYQFPHTCSMNIRYASPLIIIGAFFLGALIQLLQNEADARQFLPPEETGGRVIGLRVGTFALKCLIGVYVASSVLVYTLLTIPK